MVATTSLRPARSAFRSLAQCQSNRLFSSSSSAQQSAPSISPRWLSDTKSRLGKLTSNDHLQITSHPALSRVSKILATEWRSLVAGSEGFLTDERNAGLLRQKVVWGEMDSMGHVNNVMYVRYAESARVNWSRNMALHRDPANKQKWKELMTPKSIGLILKSIKVDYKFPMTWPDHVSVFHKLHAPPDPNSASFLLDVMILSETQQRPAARAFEDIVVYNYPEAKKVNLPPFMVEEFGKLWSEQEAEKKRALGRVAEVDGLLEELEASVRS